jgi:uncharacterized DUF497 family protein
MARASFEWDRRKDAENQSKHGVPFVLAQHAFADRHSTKEQRYFCFGPVGDGVLTVRFTHRSGVVRIFGAGYWRKGKVIYERENQVHE